jgi:hypothetical protein
MTNSLEMDYPALYSSANTGSNDSQSNFLAIVKSEIFSILVLSVYSAVKNEFNLPDSFQVITLVILMILLVVKLTLKLDQKWYQCRALAESVKTASWRYVMRAHPFEDAVSLKTPQSALRKFLNDILKANNTLGNVLSTERISDEQLPEAMNQIRKLDIEQRRKFYIKNRIDEQRNWYSNKAVANKKSVKIVALLGFSVYVIAIFSVISEDVNLKFLGFASDPLLVIATSLIGWMQLKKYSELSASYALTATEIGILKTRSSDITTETEFSDFVNEAETAFSREHTQWAARKDVS